MPKAPLPKIQNPSDFVAFATATFLGSGLSPIAPGTMGSVAATLFYYLARGTPLSFKIGITIVFFVIGTWASRHFDRIGKSKDHSAIVIDEVVGIGILACFLGDHWVPYLVVFALFRFFDILKFFPVSWVDRKSKDLKSDWGRALAVMLDDVVAAVQALVILVLIFYLFDPKI